MAVSGNVFKAMLMLVVFGVMFPVFGFAFTFQTGSAQTGFIDHESLIQAGIEMHDFVSQELNGTQEKDWTLSDFTYTVYWDNASSILYFSRQADLVTFLSWPLYTPPAYINNTLAEQGGPFKTSGTILDDWNSNYNWTHIYLKGHASWLGLGDDTDCDVLITIPRYANGTQKFSSIAVAMINHHSLQITIGRSFKNDAPTLFTFANWFTRLLTGVNDYAMPVFLVWIIRIMSMAGLICGTLLLIEIIPL